jgi:hypothetical protein
MRLGYPLSHRQPILHDDCDKIAVSRSNAVGAGFIGSLHGCRGMTLQWLAGLLSHKAQAIMAMQKLHKPLGGFRILAEQ